MSIQGANPNFVMLAYMAMLGFAPQPTYCANPTYGTPRSSGFALGCNRSHLLPYKSSNTATVP